jgi:hypothetical protein
VSSDKGYWNSHRSGNSRFTACPGNEGSQPAYTGYGNGLTDKKQRFEKRKNGRGN